MGTYLNEGNRLYRQSVNSEIHVDKSLLIRETNKRIRTHDKHHTCVIERVLNT